LIKPKTDSLKLLITDRGTREQDTVIIDLKQWGQKKKAGKKDATVRDKLQISTNLRGGKLNQYRNNPEITFSYPLQKYDFSKVLLVEEKDTVRPAISIIDTVKRRIRLHYKWKEEKHYRIIIPDSTLYSLNGLTNDSIFADFRTKAEKDFGSFHVTVTFNERPGNYIIQLLDEKENILLDTLVYKEALIKFDYLNPGKYKVKAILDRNQNGRWDTGDYSKFVQPEEVFYFPKPVEIRGNWDVDESWGL
jgi:hypothetical protein